MKRKFTEHIQKEQGATWEKKRYPNIFPFWYIRDYIEYYKWCKQKIRKWSKKDIFRGNIVKVKSDYYVDEPSSGLWIQNYRQATQEEIASAKSIFECNDNMSSEKYFWLSSEKERFPKYERARFFELTHPYKWTAWGNYYDNTLYIELDAKTYMERIAQKQVFVLAQKLPTVLLAYIVTFAIDFLKVDIRKETESVESG